jgi:hypothetical protein
MLHDTVLIGLEIEMTNPMGSRLGIVILAVRQQPRMIVTVRVLLPGTWLDPAAGDITLEGYSARSGPVK